MGKEQENFVKETIGNNIVSKWVEKKLEDLCRLNGIEIPEEARWEYGIIEEEEPRFGGMILCQREFNDKAVGFNVYTYRGQISAASVFLDLPDKFICVRKERYKKEYYYEIPLK